MGKDFYLEVDARVPAGWDAPSLVLRHSGVVFMQLQWLMLTSAILQVSSVAKPSEVLCVAEAGRTIGMTIGILRSEGCWGLPVLVEGIPLDSWPCMLVDSSIRARVLGLGTCKKNYHIAESQVTSTFAVLLVSGGVHMYIYPMELGPGS